MSSDDLKERCILCGDDRRDGIAIAFDRVVPRREDYEYTRCRNCRLVSLSPRPEPHEIADFYSADYEPHVRATEDPRRLRPSRGSRRGVLEPHGSNRLLDVDVRRARISGIDAAALRGLGYAGVEEDEDEED